MSTLKADLWITPGNCVSLLVRDRTPSSSRPPYPMTTSPRPELFVRHMAVVWGIRELSMKPLAIHYKRFVRTVVVFEVLRRISCEFSVAVVSPQLISGGFVYLKVTKFVTAYPALKAYRIG